jgi:GNAT superfamily N-acetyltransferase
MKSENTNSQFSVRTATEADCALILSFIRELAEYEKLLHEVVASEDQLRKNLFSERRSAEVIIGEWDGEPVAFALFFNNFSTFLGKPGLYLEDLYVRPTMRGKGLGKRMLAYLARQAIARDYGRMEWWVLDWNKPAIDFYHSLGAVPMDEWTVQRLTGEALSELAATSPDSR